MSDKANIFSDAAFGDRFIDKGNNEYIYHKSEMHQSGNDTWEYHYLIFKPKVIEYLDRKPFTYAPYVSYVNIDGVGVPSEFKYGAGTDRVKEIENSPNNEFLIVKKL